MNNRFTTIIAIASTALSPVLATRAFATTASVPTAAGANAATLQNMADQCTALAAAQTPSSPNATWSAVLVQGGDALVSGPTETGPRTIDLNSVVGTGSYTWGGIKIVGDPFRNGGSVNMFGNQRATEKNFSSSTYDYTADFNSTFAYALSCDLTEMTHYPAVHIDGTPVQGYYTNNGTNPSGGEGSCQGVNPNTIFWGFDSPNGQCQWHWTADAVDPVDTPAHDDVTGSLSLAGTPVNQDQTDNFPGHEANGGPVTLAGDLFVGNPVICISPKRLPGIWQTQNGYTGLKCTTAWFSVAPWGNGSTDSNGTYISVPAY